MTIAELIMKLVDLEEAHGSDIECLVNHSCIGDVQRIPAENGCPSYVSLESE